MTVLEIKKYPDPVLRKRCQKVKEVNDEVRKIIDDIKETMREKKGVGLAANQVGIFKRIIVIDLDYLKQGIFELVNPEIISRGRERETDEEGCLSFPDLFLRIKRHKEVEVQAQDRNGKEVKISAKGLLAKVLQHEIDHLDGVLFLDRLPFWQKLKFKLKIK